MIRDRSDQAVAADGENSDSGLLDMGRILRDVGMSGASPAGTPTGLPPTTPQEPPAGGLPSAEGRPDPDLPHIPGYVVLKRLGRGGMGVVYLARQLSLDRLVALKMIQAGRTRTCDRQRFQTEMEALGRLNNPHIVTIHDTGEHAGQLYYSMEYVAGGSLEDWAACLSRRTWPPS
jgi:eukaryotic-like serine/threonine-protein kinase